MNYYHADQDLMKAIYAWLYAANGYYDTDDAAIADMKDIIALAAAIWVDDMNNRTKWDTDPRV